MNMKKLVLSLLLIVAAGTTLLQAQDTLPKFSLKNVGNNRIIIGWTNTFESIKQISIQRSFDSLKGFKTILTVADPTIPQNGYMDTKATNDHMFYRLYIMLDKGVYFFSDTKRPVKDSMQKTDPITNKLIDKFPGTDSVAVPNIGNNKPRPNAFTPSLYVYTHRDGYVRISLPDEEKPKKYSIKFFDDTDTFIFELKEIKEKEFKIDKTNFYRAGWFRFELYEDGKLFEKHKFYLDKELVPTP
ncbi:hypothetical protein CAP36_03605 [Chitinophagaceae bacterium IBVUCB2]|nr:hypothetical protein CAP36_03605 [Chitinophagaceae bacterium IBVUCB2]